MLVMVRRAGADGGRVLVTTMAAVHWNRSTAEASTQRGVHEKRDSKLAAALVLQGPTTLTTARSSEGAARQRRRGAGRRGAESRWQFGLVGRGYCNREPNLLEPARRFARTSNQKCYYWSSSSGRCYDHILFLLPPVFLLLHACTAVLVDSGNAFLFCCSRLRVLLEPVYNYAGTSFFFFRR